MEKFFSRLKMKQKIILITVVSIFLVWMVVVCTATLGMQKIYAKKVDRIIRQTVEQTSRYVSTELKNLIQLGHYSLLDEQVQRAIRRSVDTDVKEYITAQSVISPMLTRLQMQNQFIESAGLILKGQLFMGANYLMRYDTQYLLEKAAQTRLIYWAEEPLQNTSTGKQVLPVVMRVPMGETYHQNHEAFMLLNVDSERLFSYMKNLEEDLGCSLILHNGGKVIYGDGALFENRYNAEYVTTDTPIEINTWGITCILERSVLYADRNNAIVSMFGISVVVTALCMLLAAWVANSVTQPILALVRKNRQVEAGDFSAQVACSGTDEIAELGRSFNAMTQKIQQYVEMLEQEKKQVQLVDAQKRKAEMRVLQSQINPHFLYNTLDSLYWYSLTGKQQQIGQIVEYLATMLRIGLSKGSETISLEKEICHAESYLKIQKIIFADKFDYHIKVDPQAVDYRIIKILLQPLVENSLRHGFRDLEQGGHIWVDILCQDAFLLLRVGDNGCGFSKNSAQTKTEFSGYALENIAERLRLHYGKDVKICIQSQPHLLTSVEVRIALEKLQGEKDV